MIRWNTLALVFALVTLAVDAGWKKPRPFPSSIPYPVFDRFMNAYAISDSWSLTFEHSDVFFLDSVVSAGIFPEKCRGDPENLYGWEYWKTVALSSVSVTSNGGIVVRFQPVNGFAVAKPETISCGPFIDKDGKQLYAGNPLSKADELLTFQIKAWPEKPFVDLRRLSGNVYVSPIVMPFTETDFRMEGILIYISLNNDVWNATFMSEIAAGLSCVSSATSTDDCFVGTDGKRMISADDFSIPRLAPNMVMLNISRERARHFNIEPPTRYYISFELSESSNLGRKFTTRGVAIETSEANVKFEIQSNRPDARVKQIWRYTPAPPSRNTPFDNTVDAIDNGINMTEDCLRGKEPESTCPRVLLFQTPRDGDRANMINFNLNAKYGLEDVRRFCITSRAQNFSNFDWVQFARRFENPGGTEFHKFAVVMKPVPYYETWVEDIMTVMPPFSTNNIGEPYDIESGYRTPMTVKIVPSPGDIYGITRNITQREIGEGGVEFEYQMDGESFTDTAMQSFVVAKLRSPNDDAWNQLVSTCVLPTGSVTFGVTPWGTTNYSHLLVKFRDCPEYETTFNDVVTVSIDATDTRSGLAIRHQTGMTFHIIKTPGVMLFPNSSDFHEANVRSGLTNFSFDIRLSSERWPVSSDLLQACFDRICDSWTTTAVPIPERGIDINSWANAARRAVICRSDVNSTSNSAFVKLSDRVVRFQGRPDPEYDTRKGEQLLVSVPDFCTASGKPTDGNETITIAPQAGFVAFHMCNDTDDGPEITELSENQVRTGGFKLCVVSRLDNFEDEPFLQSAFRNEMFNELQSLNDEAFGFNNKKVALITRPSITSTRVAFDFLGDTTYDIAANETLKFNVSNAWMASGAAPTPQVLTLRLYVSAGAVQVIDWFGAHNGGNVTEDDVRWGRVWFDFSLIGDQWRRERNPYTEIWSGDLPDATTDTFSTAVSKLIPEIAFFTFSVLPTGHEVLRLQLQSNQAFDLPRRETVAISFSSGTVASGIPPVFFVDGGGFSDSWTFFVDATPGRVIMSGATQRIDEKMIRRSSSVTWFLSLVGETWRPNASNFFMSSGAVTSYNALSDPSTAAAGFERLKATLLPATSIRAITPRTLRIDLVPNRFFEIVQTETVRFSVTSALTRSGLAPSSVEPLEIPIIPTGGELRLARPVTVTEDDVRSRNFTVELALDGDQWNMISIQQGLSSFLLDGFSSLSPILREPRGFLHSRETILRTAGTPVLTQNFNADASTIVVYLFPTPSYDIDSDETITFSVSKRLYVTSPTGDLPDPGTVSFTVRAVSRTLVVIVDPNLAYTSTFETQPQTFESVVSALMAVSTGRLEAQTNTSARREGDQMLVMLLKFVGTSSTDPRTPAELANTLMALNRDFTFAQMGARYIYFQDDPPPRSELYPSPPQQVVEETTITTSTLELILWICSAVAFSLIVAIAFVVFMRLQRRHLAVGLTTSGAVEDRPEDDGDFELRDADLRKKEETSQVMRQEMRVRELAERLRLEGNAAAALELRRGGVGALERMEKQQQLQRSTSHASSDETPSSGDLDDTKLAAAAQVLRTSQRGDVTGHLSTGHAVERPMTMKEYVRKFRLGEADGVLTSQDFRQAEDDECADEFSESRIQSSPTRKRRVNEGDANTDHSQLPTAVGSATLPASTLPRAVNMTEGKDADADLAELRKRRANANVRRRRAAVDSMVDF